MSETDRFVWVDTETFGLDPRRDWVLEIGMVITDMSLHPQDYFEVQIWDSGLYETRFAELVTAAKTEEMSAHVLEMHTKNDLFRDCRQGGILPGEGLDGLLDWLKKNDINRETPMCGSSVQFDRFMLDMQFSEAAEMFSYRNIDISTIKETCKRLAPFIYAGLDEQTQKRNVHRVIPDIRDTVEEFSFYMQHFLKKEW